MRVLIAFLKKEWMEQFRSGKEMILGILFLLFGVMNPAVAKLTPWLFEVMADTLAQSGVTVTEIKVSALDSWVQFFKNVPMALIVFVLLESNIFTKEYQSGTVVLALTKGLDRKVVVVAKTTVLVVLWTVGYWLCFGVTYGYNAYFWDNSAAQYLIFSVFAWWLFGLWVVSLVSLFSVLSSSGTGVLLGTGGVVLAAYLVSLFAKIKPYSPTLLVTGNELIYGKESPEAYLSAIAVTVASSLVALASCITIIKKKILGLS